MSDFTALTPTAQLPLDDDDPFEVRTWIIAVLLSEPRLFSDDEAEEIAGKFHGTGLDLKTANIGELKATSCLGPIAGMRVHERVDRAQGGVSVHLAKPRATNGWSLRLTKYGCGRNSLHRYSVR